MNQIWWAAGSGRDIYTLMMVHTCLHVCVCTPSCDPFWNPITSTPVLSASSPAPTHTYTSKGQDQPLDIFHPLGLGGNLQPKSCPAGQGAKPDEWWSVCHHSSTAPFPWHSRDMGTGQASACWHWLTMCRSHLPHTPYPWVPALPWEVLALKQPSLMVTP